MYYKGEFMVLVLWFIRFISVFSLESNASGCVCATRGSLWFYAWVAISTITR